MSRVYKKHTAEFKERAVKMVLEKKQPKAQVSRSLGISPSMLDQWIAKFDQSGNVRDQRGRKQENEPSRVKELERQLAEVTMERDILKKAAAYFAKESL